MAGLFETVSGKRLPRLTPRRWKELRSFPLKSDDVFICSYPKSGTSWMQQIVKLLRNGGQKDDVLLDRAIPWLEVLDSDFGSILGNYIPDMASSKDMLSPRVFKSHFPYEMVPGGPPHTTPAKYIIVLRNPKDVCVSFWHHKLRRKASVPTDTPIKWDDYVSDFVRGTMGWASWFDYVMEWWEHKDSPNFLFIKYEDMKTCLSDSVHTVADFIGVEVTEKLIEDVVQNSSFSSMKGDDTCNYSWQAGHGKFYSAEGEFIRKGEVGNWKEYFTEDQKKQFDDMCSKLRDAGLELADHN